jgi:hypothetical protein
MIELDQAHAGGVVLPANDRGIRLIHDQSQIERAFPRITRRKASRENFGSVRSRDNDISGEDSPDTLHRINRTQTESLRVVNRDAVAEFNTAFFSETGCSDLAKAITARAAPAQHRKKAKKI